MISSKDFEQRVAAAWPPAAWQEVTVLIAVSGGADSVALLRALARLKSGGAGRLLVAHFNHALRREEAVADEQFVVELCRQLGLECHVGHAPSGLLPMRGDGLEAAAREARYQFLQAAAEAAGARYAVTAHTADDQAETILHRVIRGTGVAGLEGIPRARSLGPAVCLLRPMLEIRRAQIEAYLAALGQPYRTDSTNQALELTRNRVRHQLLPLLAEQFNPAIVESLVRLGKLAADAQDAILDQSEELLDAALVSQGETSIVLDCERMAGMRRHLVREVLVLAWQRQAWPLQAMGFNQWDELAGLVQGGAMSGPDGVGRTLPKKMFPGEVTVAREGTRLKLVRKSTP